MKDFISTNDQITKGIFLFFMLKNKYSNSVKRNFNKNLKETKIKKSITYNN